MRQARVTCHLVRQGVEREVGVRWLVLLGFLSRLAPDRDHVPYELEDPDAVGAEPDQGFLEDGEEVQEGHAATWPSWRQEAGVCRADGRLRSGWKGTEDVGVFDGLGRD